TSPANLRISSWCCRAVKSLRRATRHRSAATKCAGTCRCKPMSNTFEPWNAQLTLAFTAQGSGRTVLARNRHEGPLLVQKALYPEGPAICHATILHPPSGIAGGDHLSMDIGLAHGSHAELSIRSE